MRLSESGPILGKSGIPSVDNAPADNLKICCNKASRACHLSTAIFIFSSQM